MHPVTQVLSERVSKALTLTGGPGVVGTAAFAEIFNKFFDIMNVTNFVNAKKKEMFLKTLTYQEKIFV